jgi:hypothetical protein
VHDVQYVGHCHILHCHTFFVHGSVILKFEMGFTRYKFPLQHGML